MNIDKEIAKGEAELARELCDAIDELMCGDVLGRADAPGGNDRVLELVIATLREKYIGIE